jgi:hypothetical protein
MGQYTNLGATGPGPDLFYAESGAWVMDQTQAFVFLSVQEAQATGIIGLPAGYRPVLIQVTVTILPPSPDGSPC